MRAPTDLPRRRSNRGRIGLVALAAILFIGLTSLRGIAGFYTDFLWFDQLGFSSVFRGILGTKLALALAFTLLFFVLMWVNLFLADRVSPRMLTVDDELVQRYRDVVAPYIGRVRIAVALVFALLVGTSASAQWNDWLLFRNAASFGVDDPQFGQDIGFYMFKLPFLQFLVDWSFVAIVTIAVVTGFAHYLNGGIRVQAGRQRVTSQVKAHISVLLVALALIKAAGYWLQRYTLNFSSRGAVDGATYTDVNAQLPAIQLLFVISLVAAALLVVNIRRQGWVLPVIAVGLWAFVSVVVGAIYPAIIQKFVVEPQENRREAPFIERNIEATREAFGLDGVEQRDIAYDEELSAGDLEEHAPTLRNVRLWDPNPLFAGATFQRTQAIRSYYKLPDVDIDRYEIDGRRTQTLIAVRELDTDNLPRDSWVNRHLEFTHGFGAVVALASQADSGRPNYILQNVPPTGTPELTQPRVYFGEESTGYAIVNTRQQELDYQDTRTGRTVGRSYDGNGGVRMGSMFRRAAFALRFGNPNPLLSSLITPSSRAIYMRSVGERVRAAAPFLRYDADPYAVILDGRIVWVQDAYTVSSRYPYSERADTDRLPDGSGLRGSFNYVRNSVKAVVDAYDGDVTFYVMDPEDPVLRTYSKAFPDLFTPKERMPASLVRHLRYPEDLFRVQTNMYGRYHITEPNDFYTAGDAWTISQDPGSGPVGARQQTTTNTVTPQGIAVTITREARMDPTYLLTRPPGDEDLSFVLLQPFVPSSRGEREDRNLTAYMVARSDPGGYGKLTNYVMPRGQQIDGPALAASKINADPQVSDSVTRFNQQGSRVLFGNMVVVPVENSIIYVRPLYVTPEGQNLPELRRVIAVLGERVVMRNTLPEALAELFGTSAEEVPAAPQAPDASGGGTEAPEETVAELLQRAEAEFAAAEQALRDGDLAEYQRRTRAGVELVREARERSGGTAPPPDGDGGSTGPAGSGTGGGGGGGGGGGSPPTTEPASA